MYVSIKSDRVPPSRGYHLPERAVKPLLLLRRTVVRHERPIRARLGLPGVRRTARQGYKRREEHFAGGLAPAGVANTYGRAGHARTYSLGETM